MRPRRDISFVLVCALLMAGCGSDSREADPSPSDSPPTSGVGVADAVLVAPAGDAPAAMYLTLTNSGDIADTLTAIETAVAERAELHRSMEHEGMVHMEPVGPLEVPSRGEIRMEPGGYHVMLNGVRSALVPGDTVVATVILSHGGRVPLRARVISYAELARGLGRGPAGGAGSADGY